MDTNLSNTTNLNDSMTINAIIQMFNDKIINDAIIRNKTDPNVANDLKNITEFINQYKNDRKMLSIIIHICDAMIISDAITRSKTGKTLQNDIMILTKYFSKFAQNPADVTNFTDVANPADNI